MKKVKAQSTITTTAATTTVAGTDLTLHSPSPSKQSDTSTTSVPINSTTSTPESYFIHCGIEYSSFSPEGELFALLNDKKTAPYFPSVLKLLKALGWNTCWCKKMNTRLIVPIWAMENFPQAFNPTFKECLQPDLLVCGIDYFTETDEGKHVLYKYIARRGL